MQKNTARSAKATESSYHIDMMLSEEKNTGHQVVGRTKQTVARASLLATLICVIEATNSQQTKMGQTVKRISKCHPWGSHGFDPVPKKSELNK